MRRIAYAATIAVSLMVVAAAAQADSDPAVPGKISEKIVGDLAKSDLDAFAADAAKSMPGTSVDVLKKNFASANSFGTAEYTDLIYSRDYGKFEKDIIYKISFPKGFLFARFLWQVHGGEWRLMNVNYKADESLPLPAGWEHIYPK